MIRHVFDTNVNTPHPHHSVVVCRDFRRRRTTDDARTIDARGARTSVRTSVRARGKSRRSFARSRGRTALSVTRGGRKGTRAPQRDTAGHRLGRVERTRRCGINAKRTNRARGGVAERGVRGGETRGRRARGRDEGRGGAERRDAAHGRRDDFERILLRIETC